MSLLRQLSFLKIISNLEHPNQAQFVIATNPPVLLAYPGATLYSFDENGVEETSYKETEHCSIARDFLNAPKRYFQHLFHATKSETDGAY